MGFYQRLVGLNAFGNVIKGYNIFPRGESDRDKMDDLLRSILTGGGKRSGNFLPWPSGRETPF